MTTAIQQPKADMMFNFDYALGVAWDIIKGEVPGYRAIAFEINSPDTVYKIICIEGNDLYLYIQYEFLTNEIFTLINPPSERFQKWVEAQKIRLMNAPNVIEAKNLSKISSIYLNILNAYELAIENGILSWAYLRALAREH